MPTIYHDFTINSSPERVFETVSTPYGLDNWWTQRSSGKQEIGSVFNLFFTEEYNWFAEVSVLKHNEQIEFTMVKAMADWLPTSFGFILKEEQRGITTVEFYHKNWDSVSKEYRVASFCWANLLRQMKQYLEEGIITPFNERN
ncbi:SRPBCC domain-containing protein [Flavobacterium amniphilum]|uniref:SRPBCC family protein n=1 Tax=Flavobacterium amniphilum TaxID=1834035 RepID=UPI002029E87B|nr:SRPBCC domain-containing protein [Flavobacterium amniphilum]MCL9804353.1 SRPBCC domain-containing protein [Flavobacterium amniphilum]